MGLSSHSEGGYDKKNQALDIAQQVMDKLKITRPLSSPTTLPARAVPAAAISRITRTSIFVSVRRTLTGNCGPVQGGNRHE
jgi:hypothetical protein